MEKQENTHTVPIIHTDDMNSNEHISPAVTALRSHVEKWYFPRFTASKTTDDDNSYIAIEGTDIGVGSV